MDDLISRQAAIDAAMKDECILNAMDSVEDGEMHRTKRAITRIIAELPPAQLEQLERCPIYDGVCGYPSDQCYDCPRHHGAQPEQRSFSCGQKNDLISRQAAIDVIFSEPLYETGMKKRGAEEVVPAIFEKIKALPSAQPEPCEDANGIIIRDVEFPKGCVYEGKNGKTEYCFLCNHADVPFCMYIEYESEAAIGIDERPCYCPLEKITVQPERKTGR